MSPTTKKILLIGGAAVAGYLVYTKVIKKSAPAPAAPTPPAGAIVGGVLTPPGAMHAFDPRAMLGMRRTETLQDIERELAGQSLGSLGRI
jgi:hypothetical protein